MYRTDKDKTERIFKLADSTGSTIDPSHTVMIQEAP